MLLIALLIIWSIVGYKFINGFFAKREMPELSLSLPINYSENLVIRDTFKLKQLRQILKMLAGKLDQAELRDALRAAPDAQSLYDVMTAGDGG